MDSLPTSNQAKGNPESMLNKTLETGAAMIQSFEPPKRLCAHLYVVSNWHELKELIEARNAFHVYVDDPTRISEANHYCAHVNDEVRQCILYDGPGPNARLIGVEYMVTPGIYERLDPEERKLWHSHVFEVKSGMLIMPTPTGVPDTVWEQAENKEMEQVIHLYGKVFNLWQTDRGDEVPLGQPKLMTSFTSFEQVDFAKLTSDRDVRFRVDSKKKSEARAYIDEPDVHPDADHLWKQSR